MPLEIQTEADLACVETMARKLKSRAGPKVFSVADLLALDVPPPLKLIDKMLPATGANLVSGPPKSNKTLLAVQMGISVASGNALFDYYKVEKPGPVLMVEQDDPGGAGSLRQILSLSRVPVQGIPFYLAPTVPFTFGPDLLDFLEGEIVAKGLRLVILDSYTALRGPRRTGVDVVKAEQMDMALMDELAKRTGCAIMIISHNSKGSAGLDWASQTAGSFMMTGATESQIQINRFPELDSNSPERLVRIRGRHLEGTEMVLCFRKDTLDHDHVLEGGAAPLYPLVMSLARIFAGKTFSPKDLSHETGVSRATAHRLIEKLHRNNVLVKRRHGDYELRAGNSWDTGDT